MSSLRSSRRPGLFLGSRDLATLLRKVGPLGCLDIGARGGVVEDIDPLGAAAYVYGFEPDEEECARLNATLEAGDYPFGELRFLPTALGPREERRTLNITRHSGASSLLLPNPDVASRFAARERYFDVTRTVPVDTRPLDDVIQDHGVINPVYMKIDVEGFELEILKGAERLLSSGLLALRSEIAFLPTRLGQPDFGEISRYLKPFGLMPMGFLYLATWRSLTDVKHPRKVAGPVPFSRGQLVHGDVLFLRNPDTIDDQTDNGATALTRLALLALLYDYVDFAHDIFMRPAVRRFIEDAVGSDGLSGLRAASRFIAKRHDRESAKAWGRNLKKRVVNELKYAFAR
ncbi:MAG: FkbM family methyltransferase [Pseudomonadota bacterium]